MSNPKPGEKNYIDWLVETQKAKPGQSLAEREADPQCRVNRSQPQSELSKLALQQFEMVGPLAPTFSPKTLEYLSLCEKIGEHSWPICQCDSRDGYQPSNLPPILKAQGLTSAIHDVAEKYRSCFRENT